MQIVTSLHIKYAVRHLQTWQPCDVLRLYLANLMWAESVLFLRRIYGPVMDRGSWRIRTNQELYQLCGENDIVKFCKLSKLRWAGHVIGQGDDDLSRRVLLSDPGGKRPRGRPRLCWEDGVEEDVARLGCRNWKIVALNREGWRKLLKEAEAHPGL